MSLPYPYPFPFTYPSAPVFLHSRAFTLEIQLEGLRSAVCSSGSKPSLCLRVETIKRSNFITCLRDIGNANCKYFIVHMFL